MKWISTLGLMLVAAGTWAQIADVSINTDIRGMVSDDGRKTKVRLYDLFGRFSLLNLNVNLDSGYAIRISERFQRFSGNSDVNQLEGAWFELPTEWRVGWIDTPFGLGGIVNDYGLGGEIAGELLFDNLPFKVAAIDNGERRPRGVIARVGTRLGVSIATGNHFAATGTSLPFTRDPERAPGIGRGYKLAIGGDASFSLGKTQVRAEFVSLRRGQTALDPDEDIADLSLTVQESISSPLITLGFSRAFRANTDHVRVEIEQPMNPKMSSLFQFRLDDGRRTFGLGLRVRL